MSTIRITRDSVCLGDDVNAPRETTLSFDATTPISDVLTAILQQSYLALIGGGHATWSVHAAEPIAVIAQQWRKPEFLPDFADNSLHASDLEILHFCYHAQQDPWFVYEQFKLKRTPNAWGRFEFDN